MKKSLLVILSMVMLLAASLDITLAGGGKRNGTAGAQELLIPVGARGLALNGSYIPGFTGAEAIYYNPAGLIGATEKTEVLFSQMSYIADLDVSYAAVTARMEELGAIGFSIKSLNFGEIPVTTVENPSGDGSTYKPTYVTIGLTYSNNLTDRIRVGATAKLVSEKIVRLSATGMAFDAGVQYSNFADIEGFRLGMVVKNLGAQMTFDGPDLLRNAVEATSSRGTQFYQIVAAGFDLPSQLEIGLSYEGKLNNEFSGLVTTTYQDNNYLNDEYKVGGELGFMDMFYARCGYSFIPQAKSDDEKLYGATYGIGVNIDAGIKITVDYGYRTTRYFDANHIFTIKLGVSDKRLFAY